MSNFSIALSGLSAANTALDITSNNIANADTVGFKTPRPSSPTCMRPAP